MLTFCVPEEPQAFVIVTTPKYVPAGKNAGTAILGMLPLPATKV